jgi:hypothetical protein
LTVEVREETGPAVVFVTQVLVGTLLFSIVLLVAFGLARGVDWMGEHGAPPWMMSAAQWAEWSLFWVDLFCFALFLLSEVLKFMVGLVKEWRR